MINNVQLTGGAVCMYCPISYYNLMTLYMNRVKEMSGSVYNIRNILVNNPDMVVIMSLVRQVFTGILYGHV